MSPSDSDQRTSRLPSPNGLCGAHDPEETGSYPPAAGSPAATEPGGQSAGHERFDFLGSLPAGGELGRLAHYRVLRLLGQGGMGLVFLAEDSLLSRPVALKVIRPDIAGAPGIAQRFMREARATAAIKHDHIVTIYQVGQEQGIPFLAMEYLKGISLAQWLDRGQRPSAELVLRIGREIAAGLSAAHRHGLIHRDIKPANIWLEAPSGRVKILDFGMARSQREDVEITHSGTVMGTPAYMAPEQARGEFVGAASDLFSLGCVLYRLCSGRLPFEGESVMAVLTALLSETPRRPRELRPDLPPALDELVMWLLAKDLADRPESAEDVVKVIKSIERELVADRQKDGLSAATPPQAVAGSTNEATVGPRQAQSIPKPRDSRRKMVITAAVLTTLAAAALGDVALSRLRHSTLEFVAVRPATIPAHHQPQGTSIAEPSPAGARQAHDKERAEHRNPRVDDSVVAGHHSLSRLEPRQAAPAIESGGRRPTPAGPAASPKPKVMPLPERSTALLAPSSVKTDNERTPVASSGETQTSAGQTQPVPERPDWGDAVDPDGDCQFELDRREYKVKIVVPGKTHLLSAEIGRMNAPRMLRAINGDFDVSVRVTGINHPGGKATTTLYPPFHGAGLLVWQDAENYVRLEIAADLRHGKTRPYVNFEYRKDGALAATSGMLNGDDSNQLRLRRRDDEILAAFSPDGAHWTSFPPLSARLNDRLEVGIAAINSSTKPLTAELEGFQVSARPKGGANGKDSVTGSGSTKTDDRQTP